MGHRTGASAGLHRSTILIRRHLITAILAALSCSTARAQCPPSWHAAPAGSASTSISGGSVFAAATYDPPGTPGPRAVFAGTFTTASSFACNRIAQWDGTMWLPLGTGMNGPVFALAVLNNELIAAGSFTTAGGVACNNIARWNGSSWSAAGSGVNGRVNCLLPDFGSSVIVGGDFTTAGPSSASHIARFNGTSWSTLGAGLSNEPDSLANFNNQIYAGGNFGSANGSATFVSGFTRWTGSTWQALGTAGTGISSGAAPPHVFSMNVFNEVLYLGGLFDLAGGIDCHGIAKFDGTTFSPVAAPGGVDGIGPPQAQVFAMTQHQNSLLVAGSFSSAGGQPSSLVARWNDQEWSQLSAQPTGDVNCLSIYRGNLVAGGGFDFNTSTGLIAHNLAQYTPGNVAAPFENLNGLTGPNGPVLAVIPGSTSLVNPTLWVAGSFTQLQGLNCNNIGQLDQFNDVTTVGNGFNAPVRVLRRFGNIIHAGGDFTVSGSVAVNRIARFTGGAWQPLGTGIANGSVSAMAEFSGNFYVGGTFTSAGGLSTIAVARWNGSAWSTLGASLGVTSSVRAMTIFNNQLIIAGILPNPPVNSPNILAYDGANFIPLGTGLGSTNNGGVSAVAVHKGELYAAGSFPMNNQTVNLARWNGSFWAPLDSTIPADDITSLQSFNGDLWAGGRFTNASNRFIPFIARLFCDCYPNCDSSTASPLLNANDFQCFLNQLASGSAYANCDGSTGNPALNANDFQCFLNRFATGCP